MEKAREDKETELFSIYEATGQTETFDGHYMEAPAWYQKALALRPADPALMNEAALAFFNAGKYREAEPLYERALAIWEKALGPDHTDVALSLKNLARLYRAQHKYEKAGTFCTRSLAVMEKAFGPDHVEVAAILNELAELNEYQGHLDQAESLFKRSLAISEKLL